MYNLALHYQITVSCYINVVDIREKKENKILPQNSTMLLASNYKVFSDLWHQHYTHEMNVLTIYILVRFTKL